MRRLVRGSLGWLVLAAGPAAAQSPTTFDACYVPEVGVLYLIGLPGLPVECLDAAHVPVSWSHGGGEGGTVTSITAGDGLLGGTITTSGTLSVALAGSGAATSVARSDHTHGIDGTTNTVVGASALGSVGTGNHNTAIGANALAGLTTAVGNTAVGSNTLVANDAGGNTAVGDQALEGNASGNQNTGIGWTALGSNLDGARNTAVGGAALSNGTTGSENTAVGQEALANAEGDRNIAIGWRAGRFVTTGDRNILVGHQGTDADNNTIRIGDPLFQSQTFIAGISGVTSSGGVAVLINGDGQLGTQTSSVQAKEDIEDVGEESRRVLELRPVRFRYRPQHDDGSRRVQYGLIAEEVAEVFPELAHPGPDGAPETVRYHLLPVLLLNELQRQEGELAAQAAEIGALRDELRALRERMR